jgi:hypothetical protein
MIELLSAIFPPKDIIQLPMPSSGNASSNLGLTGGQRWGLSKDFQYYSRSFHSDVSVENG